MCFKIGKGRFFFNAAILNFVLRSSSPGFVDGLAALCAQEAAMDFCGKSFRAPSLKS